MTLCPVCLGSGHGTENYQDGRPVLCIECGGTGFLSDPPVSVQYVSDADLAQSGDQTG